jgi:hypothetical protein
MLLAIGVFSSHLGLISQWRVFGGSITKHKKYSDARYRANIKKPSTLCVLLSNNRVESDKDTAALSLESGLIYAAFLTVTTLCNMSSHGFQMIATSGQEPRVELGMGFATIVLYEISGIMAVCYIFHFIIMTSPNRHSKGLLPTLMLIVVGLGVDTTTVVNSMEPKLTMPERRANWLSDCDLEENAGAST